MRTATPTMPRPAVGAARPIAEVAADLEALLGEYLIEYRALASASRAHLAAIASADRREIETGARAQQEAAGRLATLDARRAALVRAAGASLRAARGSVVAGREVTVTEIAALCAEPRRSSLAARAEEVRRAAEGAQEQQRTLGLATRTLMAHMQGLMEQVGRALSHAGTYARPGAAGVMGAGAYGPLVTSSLDLMT